MSSRNSKAVMAFYVVLFLLMILGYAMAQDVPLPPVEVQPTSEYYTNTSVTPQSPVDSSKPAKPKIRKPAQSRTFQYNQPAAQSRPDAMHMNSPHDKQSLAAQPSVAPGVHNIQPPTTKKTPAGLSPTVHSLQPSSSHKTTGGVSPEVHHLKHKQHPSNEPHPTASIKKTEHKSTPPVTSKEGIHNPKGKQVHPYNQNTVTDNGIKRPPSKKN